MKRPVHIVVGVFLFVQLVTVLLCFTGINVYAAEVLTPDWNLQNVATQTRRLTTNYSGTGAIVGAGSIYGDVSDSSLTVDGLTVSTEDNPQAAYEAGSAFITGGAVYHATASNNTLNVNNSTIQGRDMAGGMALLDNIDNRLEKASASSNTTYVKDSSILYSSSFVEDGKTVQSGGSVYGGISRYGNGVANNNTVILDNTQVDDSVFGAYLDWTAVPGVDYDEETGELLVDVSFQGNNNTVQILNGSVVNGGVYGSYGAEGGSGNTITVDNSTVNSVYGAQNGFSYYKSGTTDATSILQDNHINIVNGSVALSAITVDAFSSNAENNSLLVDNSTVLYGQLRAVRVFLGKVDDTPINAQVAGNQLTLSNIGSGLNLYEIGAQLNMAGTANTGATLLANVSDLTVSRGLLSFGVLDVNTLTNNQLFTTKNTLGQTTTVPGFNDSYGFIYGGAALDYTTQSDGGANDTPPALVDGALPASASEVPEEIMIANGGNQSDGNTVYMADSTVKANVVGGFSGQLKEIDYTTWSYTPAEGTNPANYTKTVVRKIGNQTITTVYQCGPSGTSCDSGTVDGDPVEETNFEDEVFSASNNTVILENTNFDGTVYGGFVAGADLKPSNAVTSNNTVILRGETSLSDDTVLYGGNSAFGQTTNHLVFDHVVASDGSFVTYKSHDQFQNFNSVWQINADLNTRLNFDFNQVNALVNIDTTTPAEGTATIIKTKTAVDLSDVEQNGVIYDLVDSSVELTQKKKGVYSYNLVGTKADASTVGWVLSSVKDKANVEIYGQLPLVGLALAAQGPEMLSRTMKEAWHTDSEQDVFINGGYESTRYTIGSGFDLYSGLAQAGVWKKFTPDWMGGLFVKYSGGHYKTFPITAKGDGYVFGGGLMTSFYLHETGRLEATAEIGKMDLDFESSELLSTLKSDGTYYGLTAGLVEEFTENWDVFANVQYYRKAADSMHDNLGQDIHYKTLQSMVVRAGTDYEFNTVWKGLVPSVGVSGLYEFDGESKVDVLSVSNNSASLKGFSGRGEFSLLYEAEEGVLPIRSRLTLFGQAGKRRGFGGEVNISIAF